MCNGDRLIADFVAGTGARPALRAAPAELRRLVSTLSDLRSFVSLVLITSR
jgi:hypothetical protein